MILTKGRDSSSCRTCFTRKATRPNRRNPSSSAASSFGKKAEVFLAVDQDVLSLMVVPLGKVREIVGNLLVEQILVDMLDCRGVGSLTSRATAIVVMALGGRVLGSFTLPQAFRGRRSIPPAE
jgi:hypothetical protein